MATLEPNIIDPEIIEELILGLYKHQRVALKEYISNGLDQQINNEKKRIEIFTQSGPDKDIVIEDYGTGIEDWAKFKHIGGGKKQVGDNVSSYIENNPEMIGYKGLGKLAGLALSGTFPRTVEFWSHRPASNNPNGTVKYRSQGIIAKWTKKGFEPEYVNSDEALSHTGVKVVIKNPRYDLLPSESKLMSYISEWFAIRIARGTEIYFNENKISEPEGFDADCGRLSLFEFDYQIEKEDEQTGQKRVYDKHTVVKGKFHRLERPERENVWIFVKNVLVEKISVDNPTRGWINCDALVPTTSREEVKNDKTYDKFWELFTEYVNREFPIAESKQDTRVADEKKKIEDVSRFVMNHVDRLLKGEEDQNGIEGEIIAGEKGKRQKLDNQKIIKGGDGEGEAIITIGDGKRGDFNDIHTGTGDNRTTEPGGDKTILKTKQGEQEKRFGMIKPDIKFVWADFSRDFPEMPLAYTDDARTFKMNLHWEQTEEARKSTGIRRITTMATVVCQAVANLLNKDKDENEIVDGKKWLDQYNKLMQKYITETK